jgi:hypothetical protein
MGPGGGMGGGGGGMGAGGMGGMGGGGGGMGGGGMGGGGGPRCKRNLTTLVGKLDVVRQGIKFELTDEQVAKLTPQLADLDQVEKITEEEAQERVDSLEAILTDEQKETLARFDLPRSGRGGRQGGGGGMGGGGPPPDYNPFQMEANQSRLHSLIERLNGGNTEKDTPAESVEGSG